MDPARASMTALGAAYRRAYHYTHDTPKVFADRFAALFVSPEEATAIENGFIHILTQARPHLRVEGDRTVTLANAIRTDTGTPLVLGRARYNEDLLDKAIHNGVTQYVLVGAGFDTFACAVQTCASGSRSLRSTINWLRVSDTAECSQVDQRIGHQLHAIVPLLDAFKAE